MNHQKDRESIESQPDHEAINPEEYLNAELISEAIQYPATIVPLFIAALAFILIILELAWVPLIGLIALGGVMLVVAIVSFVWRFYLRYEEDYGHHFQILNERREQDRRVRRQEALQKKKDLIKERFTSKEAKEGLDALDRLGNEFRQIDEVLREWPQSSVVSISQLWSLSEQTYRQGLNALESLTYLHPSVSTTDKDALSLDIQALEGEIEDLGANDSDSAELEIRQARLSALRQRLGLANEQRLKAEETLLKISQIEGALSRTRIELVALRTEGLESDQIAVSESLQRAISQAKEVLDEMRNLGF